MLNDTASARIETPARHDLLTCNLVTQLWGTASIRSNIASQWNLLDIDRDNVPTQVTHSIDLCLSVSLE
jgi:hypothetical protein